MSTLKTASLQHPDASANAISMDTSGNVGIGTDSPAAPLHVKLATDENVRISTLGSGDTRISALNDAASATTQLSVQGSPLLFRSAGGVEAMRIAANGNIGIGTDSPEHMLHLKGSYPYIAFSDTDGGATSKHTITGNSDGNIYFDSVLNSSSGNSGFRFRQNAAAITSMAINANGIVTMPYQPAFNARGDTSTLYGSGWAKVLYGNLVAQRGSHYTTATSRFTAPVSGWYQFNASVNFNQSTDADGALGFIINASIGGVQWGTVMQSQTGGNYNGRSVSATIALSTNDYVEVYRYSTVNTTSRSNPWEGNFSGFLIG